MDFAHPAQMLGAQVRPGRAEHETLQLARADLVKQVRKQFMEQLKEA